MSKKRGGKHRKRRGEVSDVAESSQLDASTENVSDKPDNDGDKACPYKALNEYVKNIRPLLSGLTKKTIGGSTNDGVDKGSVNTERDLLLRQILKEIKGKEALLMRDQQGSKMMDQVARLLGEIIEQEFEKPSGGGGDAAIESSEDAFTLNDAICTLKAFILKLAEDDPSGNCSSCYASHCAQSLLSLVPLAITIEMRAKPLSNEDRLSMEETFICFLTALRDCGIGHLMSHACATHVVRSCLLVLAGYVPNKETKECELSRRALKPSDGFLAVLVSIVEAIIEEISNEKVEYATNAYASPVLQLTLKILQTLKLSELQQVFVNQFLLVDAHSVEELKDTQTPLDSLLDSAAGSRLAEALLKCSSKVHIHALVWNYLRPSSSHHRLNQLATHRYGNYFIQQLLCHEGLDAAGLQRILEELDFKLVLNSHCRGVVRRVVDAARRVQACHQLVLTKLLEALNVNFTAHYPLLWWSLISCRNAWDLPRDLVSEVDTPEARSHLDKGVDGSDDRLIVDPTGCSILSGLLKFPKDSITPLIQSFKPFASKRNREYLLAIARDRQGSWLLQAVLDEGAGGNPLSARSQAKLVRLFLGSFSQLAFHPHGSFVVRSCYVASPVDLKKSIVEELRSKADELKVANFALYKALELGTYSESTTVWADKQTKKLKLQELFADVVQPSNKERPQKVQRKLDEPSNKERPQKVQRKLDEKGTGNHGVSSSEPVRKKRKKLQ